MTTTAEVQQPQFTYGMATVSNLKVNKVSRTETGRVTLRELELDGRPVIPTKRFWKSFFSRFGIAETVFRYFSPNEVFERISQMHPDDSFRFCISNQELKGVQTNRLLAITNIKKPVIRYDHIAELVQERGGMDVTYRDGLLTSFHAPRGGSRQIQIGGDQFRDRFCMETPVDGYGHPRLFLSMMRMVCSNGMIGYSRAFRSDIPVGKDMVHCIGRALESFDNDEGYVALRKRFESAQTSWASVHECLQLGAVLERIYRDDQTQSRGLLGRFRSVAGDMSALYGLANLEALSDKRKRILPSRARVYDLINFASEVATHHADPEGANRMQAYIGSLISDEYDLEGTAKDAPEFDAFFVDESDAIVRASVN